MKISKEEIDAANEAIRPLGLGEVSDYTAKIFLEAAFAVRKERKKAKREAKRSILDDDQQAAIKSFTPKHLPFEVCKFKITEKPLPFEVGKSYRTRDGRRANIHEVIFGDKYPIRGQIEGKQYSWAKEGLWQTLIHRGKNPNDLISEWQD